MTQKFLLFILLVLTTTTPLTKGYGISTILTKFDTFLNSISSLKGIPQQNIQIAHNNHPLKSEMFDFIIVGSGSAGAVIANRLSEITQWRILLLEAGKRANNFTQVPLYAPNFQLTHYNWNYTMEKQDGICLAMIDQICSWPRGKALGGTTVINYMIYTRGNPLDYQKWEAQGNPGWSYNDVLPYYLKSENCNLGNDICQSKYHNQGGYVSTEYPFSSRLTQAFLEAGVESGHKIVDYNSNQFFGYAQIQATLKQGRRVSTATAYLDTISSRRKNLKILTSAHVTKLLINPETKEINGVDYIRHGKKFRVKATKEVILSAGTFNSPQLLMLSGIGPKEHLDELGIKTITNLPVGKLLYDHIAFLGLNFKMNETVERRESIFYPSEIINWFKYGRGVYSSLAGIEALAYIKTELSKEFNNNYPDIELIFSGAGSLEADFGVVAAREYRIKRSFYNKHFKPLEIIPCWSILPMLLHPKSRGYLKLRSNNPFDPPLLYGNFFTETDDIKTFIAAIRYIIKLSHTKAFQKFNSILHDSPLPGCEQFQFNSDDYWECALRHLTQTLHHQIGTCKMGPKDDVEAVVDSELRVYGVKKLRVADTSIIPVTLSAHTSAPAMMIGEKVSDIIKKDWGVL